MHCVSAGRGVVLTTHPLLAPRLRMSRAIPLLPSRPMVACYRVTFTLQEITKATNSSTHFSKQHMLSVTALYVLPFHVTLSMNLQTCIKKSMFNNGEISDL
jgi:hypothetical protein